MNWSELWNSIVNLQPGLVDIALRLACAMLVGLVIGTEREYTHRPAGMRTHILVALGACVVSITGELIFNHYSGLGAVPDPARLSAQVITGVGFLGAGTILREGFTVKGLTTAASVWATACLGIAAGFGYYALAIFGMVGIFVTLTFFEWLQKALMRPGHGVSNEYILETGDITKTLAVINEHSQMAQAAITDLHAEVTERGHRVTFNLYFRGRHAAKHRQAFFDDMIAQSSTLSLEHVGERTASKT